MAPTVAQPQTLSSRPRSVSPPPLTGADRKAYTEYVEAERRLPPEEQEVAVRFPQEAHGDRA